MRETQAWADWELDLLEKHHALHGTAFVQAKLARRGVTRSQFSIRHKASRLGLSHAMQEFTPMVDVAQEAGVTPQAVHWWLTKHGYRRHCRTWGRELLVPAPVVALYLNERRAPGRPRGWWGVARTADTLGCEVRNVYHLIHAGKIDAVQHGKTFFIDPYSVRNHQQKQHGQAHATEVKVVHVARLLGVSPQYATRRLKELQVPTRLARCPGGRGPALHMSEAHAQAFVSAGSFRADVLDTLIRKAQAVDLKPGKSQCGRRDSRPS